MGRKSKPIFAICAEYGDEFMVYNEFLLMCKSCKLLVPVKKRSRIAEHLTHRDHLERKADKIKEMENPKPETLKAPVPDTQTQEQDFEEVRQEIHIRLLPSVDVFFLQNYFLVTLAHRFSFVDLLSVGKK